MSCFCLPGGRPTEPGDRYWVHPKHGRAGSTAPFNPTLQGYLKRVKQMIDTRQDEWDRFKKFTNPYEYVHTPVPNSKQAVCRLKPLSRSFYKMIEILATCELASTFPEEMCSFHVAEGPGGFIEALAYQRDNLEDAHIGMTLQDDDAAVPGWKKSIGFIKSHPQVAVYDGADGTGDLMSVANLLTCLRDNHDKADLVTGDGGFDFSVDFDSQEASSMGLVVAQMAFAIAAQRMGGCFVLKVFDTFTQATMDALFLLSGAYETVRVLKPQTSRQGNSEKYVVCAGFRLVHREAMVLALADCLALVQEGAQIQRLINHPLPYYFTSRVEEMNAVLGQQQIESITSTLLLMDSCRGDRLESLKKSNIQKCISWCQRHHLPYNRVPQTTNIFMSGRQRSKGRS